MGAFMTVIAVEEGIGSNTISDYAGLMKRSPWLAGTMLVFLLSLAGIPATGGFIGKLFVFGAAIQVRFIALAVVGILNSAIAVFYYFNVIRYMFFTPARRGCDAHFRADRHQRRTGDCAGHDPVHRTVSTAISGLLIGIDCIARGAVNQARFLHER